MKSLVGGVEVEPATTADNNNNSSGDGDSGEADADADDRKQSREAVSGGSSGRQALSAATATVLPDSPGQRQPSPPDVRRPVAGPTISRRRLEGICVRGIPLLVKGRPLICTATVCP